MLSNTRREPTLALPTHEVPQSPDGTGDMDRLLSTADQIRAQVDELMRLREAALHSAQTEAREVVQKAEEEAHQIVAEANQTATSVIDQANSAAGDTIRSLRDQMSDLIDAMTHRKSMLDTALSAMDASDGSHEDTPSESDEAPIYGTAEPDTPSADLTVQNGYGRDLDDGVDEPTVASEPKPGPLAPRTYSLDRYGFDDLG